MPPSNQLCTIAELPDVSGLDEPHRPNHNIYGRFVYCLVLTMRPVNSNCELYVTDFTSNDAISSICPVNPDFTGYTPKVDEMLPCDVFPDKIESLKQQFMKATHNEFQPWPTWTDPLPGSIQKDDEVWTSLLVVKVGVVPKLYKNRFEGKIRGVWLVTSSTIRNRHLDQLYDRMFSIIPPADISRINRDLAQYLLPPQQFSRFLGIVQEFAASRTRPVRVARIVSQENQSTPLVDSTNSAPNSPETFVKLEKAPAIPEKVLDTQFNSDYSSGSEQGSPDEDENLEIELFQRQPATSNGSNNIPSSQPYTLLGSLNKERNPGVSFVISAYVVGTVPEDWSHICTKSYEYDSLTQSVQLSDPVARGLQIILSDVELGDSGLSRNSPETLLSLHNSLTITITPQETLKFFNQRYVEQLYTSVKEYNNKFARSARLSKKHELEVLLVKDPKTGRLYWSALGLTIDRLLGS